MQACQQRAQRNRGRHGRKWQPGSESYTLQMMRPRGQASMAPGAVGDLRGERHAEPQAAGMAARPPQALKAATPSAWLLSTVRHERPRQAREAPAVMAVVLSRMPRPLAARGAGRPRWPLGALLSEPALKIAESDSSTQQLCGSDDHGVSQQWLWQRLAFDVVQREYAARATIQHSHRRLHAARARRSWALRVGARPHVPVRVQWAAHA